MPRKRKSQQKDSEVAADQNVRPSNVNASPLRSPTVDQFMQKMENGVNALTQIIEEFKKCQFEAETEPLAKKPKMASKRKATNAQTRKPANAMEIKQSNTQEEKATNTVEKEPRKPSVKKATNTQAKKPTTGPEKKPRKSRVVKAKINELTEPTSLLDMIEDKDKALQEIANSVEVTSQCIRKMEQEQLQRFLPVAPAKADKRSAKSKPPKKIKQDPRTRKVHFN
ncbi:uncharacterized protein DMAD_05575 [Drosophila madeirensis]|uniref:Uncharacterized protein n=1 Tax=Drosophila madeirensis TaxID=30013 RepID=A0AAU9FNN8_DROMD